MPDEQRPGLLQLVKSSGYSLYVLAVMLAAYLLNQLDRYALGIVSKPMAQDIHFGDKVCMINHTVKDDSFDHIEKFCKKLNESSCQITEYNNTLHVPLSCEWNYDGSGTQYDLVAGPIFIVIYTFAGIFLGLAADRYSRKVLMAICLLIWTSMTLLTGFVKSYWQLVLTRFGLGIGEAGCTPFAASLIADYFSVEIRGAAMGVYNWGIYTGFSMSFAIGNFITDANINGQGWRWSFFLSAIPGFVVAALIFFTVKEPIRADTQEHKESINKFQGKTRSIILALYNFRRPSILLLCLAGSIRNAGGYVWAYNAQTYFMLTQNQSREQVGEFMSWIPLVGGSLGVAFGGFISDRIVMKRGLYARVMVLVVSQLVAAPFAAGVLFLDTPWAYISLIPSNIFGEMWVGVTMTVLVELVPSSIRTTSVAVYLFIISNIGGNTPLLVTPIQNSFMRLGYTKNEGLRGALYILFPGLYVAGALLFLLTLVVIKRDSELAKREDADSHPLTADS